VWGWVLHHPLWLGHAAAIPYILGVLVVVGHVIDFTHSQSTLQAVCNLMNIQTRVHQENSFDSPGC